VANLDRIRELTERALDDFDSGKSVSALVRQAHRIATLRHDYAACVWFEFQQREIGSDIQRDDPVLLELRGKLIALLGDEAGQAEYLRQFTRWEGSRAMVDSKNIHPSSVDQLETMLSQTQQAYDEMQLPPNLTPIDAALMARDRDSAQGKLIPLIGSLRNILSKVRQSVHNYLVAAEAELDAGRDQSSFFDHAQMRINTLMNTYAPEATAKFLAAQDSLSSGGAEDISHALTSCRRMIKALADAVYPATDQEQVGVDGVSRKMTDEAYKNRLLQFVREQVGKHKSGPILLSVITDLGKRLDTLDSLASKGVHADASLAEAQTCLVQTYLLAGDLLAIAEGTSLYLKDTEHEQN
jgi:hypothetical protein